MSYESDVSKFKTLVDLGLTFSSSETIFYSMAIFSFDKDWWLREMGGGRSFSTADRA